MKNEFIGFYDPTEKEITDAWNKGAFAFDANTLLNLYRYSDLTRKDFLSALKTIKEKLFLPYQAALEYHSNRINVIDNLENSYLNLYKVFEKNFESEITSQLNQFKRHPTIELDSINKIYSEFLKKISTEIENQKKTHPDFKTKDEVLEQLTDLFKTAIGKDFSKEDLQTIYNDGRIRFAESIPPGYRDFENKRKKGDRNAYGDLIIWKELIGYSKKEKKPLIFVTDDRKDDWWKIENGKTIRPREELIKEFYDITGIRILIYNADSFLHFAKERKLVPKLKDKTIEEVKDVRISDEKTLSISEMLENYNIARKSFSETLGSYNKASKPLSISDMLDNYNDGNKRLTISEILNNYNEVNKSIRISDFINKYNDENKRLNIPEIIAKQFREGIEEKNSENQNNEKEGK